MSEIKKLYTHGEVCKKFGITSDELSQITKRIPGYAKRKKHRFTEDELSQIKTAIKNCNS